MADERVLIVDDEESVRGLLGRLCQREGYEVLLAENGARALQQLEVTPFDVAIVDLHLPDISGIDVLRRAKELNPSGEVIILTGFGDLETAVEALRLGAYDYLQKPLLNLHFVPLIIARALERRRLAQRNEQLVQDLQEANRKLEQRRNQQLRLISHIGQALAGGLRSRDVAQVLVQAILGSTACDGAGVLLVPQAGVQGPLAVIGAQKVLSVRARRALLTATVAHLPPTQRFDSSEVVIHALPMESGEIDDERWRRYEFDTLMARDNPLGVISLASHRDAPFGDDVLGIFRVLVTQGSIALENAHLFSRMCELATRDSLTGLYNHGHFFELLEAEISRAERYEHALAVVMLDLDKDEKHGLKFINDTYGHQAGDALLRQVAALLTINVRRADAVARYGGDEFAILAPQTDTQEALVLADRVWRSFHEMPFLVAGHEIHVTVSVGVGVFRSGKGQSVNGLVDLADQGLYLAKERGRDQVAMAPSD